MKNNKAILFHPANIVCGIICITFVIIELYILNYPLDESLRAEYYLSNLIEKLGAVIFCIYFFTAVIRRNVTCVIRLVLIFIFTFPVTLSSSARGYELRAVSWEFDGIISRKYESHNHAALSVEIEGDGAGNYENINPYAWERIQVGDRITKHAHSPYARLNNEIIIVTPERLADSTRGESLFKSTPNQILDPTRNPPVDSVNVIPRAGQD